MALNREQIEHFEHWWEDEARPWKNHSRSRKKAKNSMSRYMRRRPIEEDDEGYKSNRKPTKGWEY